MKKKFLSIVFFLVFSTNAIAHPEHYKSINILEYELFRNDKSIGYHNYKFEKNKDILNVKSIIDFKISKLGIDVYKYNGSTEEVYANNQLTRFISNTNQNNKIKSTKIIFDEKKNKLIISGTENQLISFKDHPVGTWWNHEITQAKAQISGVSGRIIDQKVTFLGKKKLNLNGKTYEALHFNFKSTDEKLTKKKRLNIDVWYEEVTNLWLKASFTKTGYWEYRLKNFN